MRTLSKALIALPLIAGLAFVSAAPAQAQWRGHRGGGGAVVGALLGLGVAAAVVGGAAYAVAPPPVYYAPPPPVYYAPPPVYYAPPPVYYAPRPVYRPYGW